MKNRQSMRVGVFMLAVWLGVGVGNGWAEESPGRSGRTYRGQLTNKADLVDEVRHLYRTGDWDKLMERTGKIFEVLKKVTEQGGNRSHKFDPRSNYYLVTLVDEDFSGEDELVRFMFHDPPTKAFELVLPGLKSGSDGNCFEVLLTRHPEVEFTSRYEFEKKEDPLVALVPKAVEKIAPGIASVLTARNFPVGPRVQSHAIVPTCNETPYVTDHLHAVVFEMIIPFKRGSIEVQNKVLIRDRSSLREKFGKSAEEINLRFGKGAPFVKAMIDAARNCFLNNGKDLKPAESYEKIFADFMTKNPSMNFDAFKQVLAADEALREIIPSWPEVAGTYTIENTPPTKRSLGLVTAGMLQTNNNGRAKVEDGFIVHDPLTGVQTMVILNCHPWSNDFHDKSFFAKERVRFFAGGVILPEIGFSAGAGYGLLAGLSVNAGWSLMAVNRPGAGEQVGQPPTESESLVIKGATSWFLGFGYNFK